MVVSIEVHEDHPQMPHNNSHRFNTKSTKWEKFDNYLGENRNQVIQILNDTRINEAGSNIAAQEIQNLILSAIEQSTPLSKPSPRSKRWWNQAISDNRSILHHRRREWKKNKTAENWHLYTVQRNLYNRTIRDAKQKMWMEFLESAKGTDTFQIFKLLKPSQQVRTPTLQDDSGTHHSTFYDKAVLFQQILFPPTPPNITRTVTTPRNRCLP